MEALKEKLQQCAGRDLHILSAEDVAEGNRVAKVVSFQERGHDSVQKMHVVQETEEQAVIESFETSMATAVNLFANTLLFSEEFELFYSALFIAISNVQRAVFLSQTHAAIARGNALK